MTKMTFGDITSKLSNLLEINVDEEQMDLATVYATSSSCLSGHFQ
jgi:hypothetical protein